MEAAGGLSAGVELSFQLLRVQSCGGGEVGRGNQVLQGQSEGGVGASLRKLQFRTPAFLGSYFGGANCRSGCLKEVGTEGRLGVGE